MRWLSLAWVIVLLRYAEGTEGSLRGGICCWQDCQVPYRNTVLCMPWIEAVQHYTDLSNLLQMLVTARSKASKYIRQYSSLCTLQISRSTALLIALVLFVSLLAEVQQCQTSTSFSQPSARTAWSKLSSVHKCWRVFTVSNATSWSSTLESFGCCKVWLSLSVCHRIISHSVACTAVSHSSWILSNMLARGSAQTVYLVGYRVTIRGKKISPQHKYWLLTLKPPSLDKV